MSKLKREDLLGYVLGALDAQEQQQIQQLIDQDAHLEDQLLSIKHSLAPLELIDTPIGPPPGLARRTCQWIAANQRCGLLGRPQSFESASELLLQQVADDQEPYRNLPLTPLGPTTHTDLNSPVPNAAVSNAAGGLNQADEDTGSTTGRDSDRYRAETVNREFADPRSLPIFSREAHSASREAHSASEIAGPQLNNLPLANSSASEQQRSSGPIPTMGLVERTIDRFPEHRSALAENLCDSVEPRRWSGRERLAFNQSWSVTDMVMVCGAALVLSAMLLPALSSARFQSRISACQENLLSLYRSLNTFANVNPRGEFIRAAGTSRLPFHGLYTQVLAENNLLENQTALHCPGRGNGGRVQRNLVAWNPDAYDCEDIFDRLQRGDFGNYGYAIEPRNENGALVGLRPDQPNPVVLLADAPHCSSPGRSSLNHEGRGQNLLKTNGQFGFQRDVNWGGDNVYENDSGIVGPGLHLKDSVIAPPHFRNLELLTLPAE